MASYNQNDLVKEDEMESAYRKNALEWECI
jgi:hypothetical protein